jgi:hypothetical protein
MESQTRNLAAKTEPDPPSLTDAYRKVHKQYGIFTGLLFAWELIGIDITEKPLSSLDVKFQSPQAVPYVLIVLMTYFSYRLWIEWMQCDKQRREVLVTRIDFYLAHGIAILALAIFAFQAITKVQLFAAIVPVPILLDVVLGAFGGFVFDELEYSYREWWWYKHRSMSQTLHKFPRNYLLVSLLAVSLTLVFVLDRHTSVRLWIFVALGVLLAFARRYKERVSYRRLGEMVGAPYYKNEERPI